MAVTNGWGQAAVNNTNGFGKGKINSTNGWGDIYDSSEAGDTNIGVSTTPAWSNTLSTTFDGVDDYVDVANNTTIARTQNISYSIWVNLDVTTRQYIIGNQSSSNGGTGLSIENGDVLLFQLVLGLLVQTMICLHLFPT